MQAADLKKQWDDQAKTKQFQATQGRLKEISDFRDDPSMTFAGEDKYADQRKREQQEQMRRWTQEDMELKAYQEAKLREEDQARAELNRAVDDYRGAQEQEEANMRKELTRRIRDENREVSVTNTISFSHTRSQVFHRQRKHERVPPVKQSLQMTPISIIRFYLMLTLFWTKTVIARARMPSEVTPKDK
jgi:hypothetical protein